MKLKKHKIFLLVLIGVTVFFLSNDFGLIDIEKTAIITALGIDKTVEGEYEATAQVAVPQATNTSAENKKAIISAKGKTIGSAIKNLGNLSGWYPKLAFCNLMIIGETITEENVIKVLDYFSKTFRLQDSACVILSEKDAKTLLTTASPLDNLSSFSLQKILLKNPGFDKDVLTMDIKTFCADYYSYSSFSMMPVVKIIEQNQKENSEKTGAEKNGDGEGSSGKTGSNGAEYNNDGNSLFDATTTALFKNGFIVGTLEKKETFTYNLFFSNVNESVLEVNDVLVDGEKRNYLLTFISVSPKIDLKTTDNLLRLDISLDVYCKISDKTSSYSNSYSNDLYLPYAVKQKAEKEVKENIESVLEIQKTLNCDILGIRERLYKYHHDYFDRYKENCLKILKHTVSVNFYGQK